MWAAVHFHILFTFRVSLFSLAVKNLRSFFHPSLSVDLFFRVLSYGYFLWSITSAISVESENILFRTCRVVFEIFIFFYILYTSRQSNSKNLDVNNLWMRTFRVQVTLKVKTSYKQFLRKVMKKVRLLLCVCTSICLHS